MNKTFRILQMINLLDHRRSVSLETFQKTCNIPERTVYRYLNTISEADIPIYFDTEERAYRLTRQGVLDIDDLSLGEAVIFVLALKLLSQTLGESYQDDIEKLLAKVLVRQQFPIEEVLPVVEHGLEDQKTDLDLSELLSSLLVNAAISCKREVKLSTKGREPAEEDVTIENPGWLFKDTWHLMEKGSVEREETALDQVSRVKIV
jgi:predicted DNA-binding transcriptional regulator YafY